MPPDDSHSSTTSNDRGSVRRAAPRLLDDKVVLLKDGHEGERKPVTILVADIPDYSSLSRKLSPEEQYQVMAHCLAIVRDRIGHFGGTMTQVTRGIAKALFGTPISCDDHAKRACEAALSMLTSFNDYAGKVRKERHVSFEIRIGIASGVIIAGSISTGVELDYSDIEDSPELISLVRSNMRPGKIVAARSTVDFVNDFFEFHAIPEHEKKRLEEEPEAYELVRSLEYVSPIHAKHAKGLSKFVGRGGEIVVLLEAAAKARNGSGQAVAVTGDAGVGKSRLVFEFKNTLPEGQQVYFEGYCRSYDGVSAYHPFLDILKSLFGIEAGAKAGSIKKRIRNRLRRLVDDYKEIVAPLYEIFALKVEDAQYLGLSFQEKRNRIFKAVEKVFVGAGQGKLLVLVLDDLHWIDRTSEELLNYLIGRISDAKILLILLYRPEYAGASRFGPVVTPIRLRELAENPTKELTEFVLGGHDADEALMAVVHDQTAGNPLFIEELVRALLDGAAVQQIEGKYILAQGTPVKLLPKTLQGVISARMDGLEQDVKTVLQVASVIGREFPLSLLERVTRAGSDLRLIIARLQELEFIRESSDRGFAFKHALTKEAAYNSLLEKSRKKIHQETGAAIEELYSDRLQDFYEQLAYHFSKSAHLQKEFQYLKLSAIKASRQNSPWEAYSFAKEALRSISGQDPTLENKKEEIEVLTVIHWAVRMLDYAPENSEQLLQRGEDLSLEIGDQKTLTLFRAALCIYYFGIGDGVSSRKYSDFLFTDMQAVEHVDLTRDLLRIAVPTVLEHCLSGFVSARFLETLSVNLKVLESMERTQALFDSYGTPFNAYSFLAAASASFSSWLGDFDNALILCRKALNVALEAKNLHSIAYAEQAYGMTLSHRGFGQEAIAHLEKSIEYFDEAGVGVAFSVTSWNLLAYAKFLIEDLDGARECFEKAISMQFDSGILFYLSSIYANLSMVHLAAGDLASARSCIDSALEWSQKSNEKHWEGLSKIFFGKILAESQMLQAAKAESSILEGIEILTELGVRPYYALGYGFLGELYVGTGRTQLGIKNLKKAKKMFEKMGMEYGVRKTQEVLDRFQVTAK